jgi:hypothetical protein
MKVTRFRKCRQGESIDAGRRICFQGFRGEQPAAAIFSLERFENGVFRVVDLFRVPVRFRPKSSTGHSQTEAWARRQLLIALEAA